MIAQCREKLTFIQSVGWKEWADMALRNLEGIQLPAHHKAHVIGEGRWNALFYCEALF